MGKIVIPQVLGQVVGVASRLLQGELDGQPHEQEHPVIQVVNAAGETTEHPASPDLQLVHVPEAAQGVMDALLPVAGQVGQAVAGQAVDPARWFLESRFPNLKDQDWVIAALLGMADETSKALANDGKISLAEWASIAHRGFVEAQK